MPAVNEAYPEMGGRERGAWHLRRDDLLFILLGVIPGAVLAARIGYLLIHLDYYGVHPEYWFDPSQGSLELSFGLIGGALAGGGGALVLGAPGGRWLHVAIGPGLLAVGVGKLAMTLGGDGQGIPADVTWATAYTGPGPWGSLAASVPSHPAQIYEGLLVLLVAALIGGLLLIGRFKDQDGRVFFAGLSLWALARVEAAFLWRDPEIFGPFRTAQIVALLIAFTCMGLFVYRAMETGRAVRRVVAARARLGRPAVVAPVGVSGGRIGGPVGAPVGAIAMGSMAVSSAAMAATASGSGPDVVAARDF